MRRIINSICLYFRSRKSLARELTDARHAIGLREQEIASLRIQIEAYRDTVQSFGWERRAVGAEAKVYAESLRGQQ